MTDCLRHRGPDDAGSHTSPYRLRPPYEARPGVALGHRRLAIIDVAGGHQPMSNEDGSVWVVLNGEIYNFGELRRRLEGAGHRFRTQSDTEVIAHLYEDDGPGFVTRLNGMFAIVLWDEARGQLVMARDRLGQKPLVYCRQAGRLLFASELKSLLEVPGVGREIDAGALDAYLTYQYVPHPRTIFRGISKLPPGHVGLFRAGQLRLERYWSVTPARADGAAPEPSEGTIAELLDSAVRLQMQSDVPLGAFLSGGVDSSLVVALMQRHQAPPVKTFSIGFAVPRYDETRYARRVAEFLGTEHHEFQVTPDAVAMLPQLVWHFDEPFADSSAIPTWCVAQRTREHVTVALSGDGGDELFAGYPRYRAVRWGARVDRLPGAVRRLLTGRFWQRLPGGARQKSRLRQWKRFTACLALPPARRYLEWIAIFGEARRAELYRDEFLHELPEVDPREFLAGAWRSAQSPDAVATAAATDLLTYLPCDLMTKVDLASMAHGLECRQPFLDHRLVEAALRIPTARKYRCGRGKRILRRALGPLLPADIWRRPKMGFGVPLDHWFRHELKELTHDLLLGPSARVDQFFQASTRAQLVREHLAGVFDHSYRLWTLLVLEMWLRRWVPPAP